MKTTSTSQLHRLVLLFTVLSLYMINATDALVDAAVLPVDKKDTATAILEEDEQVWGRILQQDFSLPPRTLNPTRPTTSPPTRSFATPKGQLSASVEETTGNIDMDIVPDLTRREIYPGMYSSSSSSSSSSSKKGSKAAKSDKTPKSEKGTKSDKAKGGRSLATRPLIPTLAPTPRWD